MAKAESRIVYEKWLPGLRQRHWTPSQRSRAWQIVYLCHMVSQSQYVECYPWWATIGWQTFQTSGCKRRWLVLQSVWQLDQEFFDVVSFLYATEEVRTDPQSWKPDPTAWHKTGRTAPRWDGSLRNFVDKTALSTNWNTEATSGTNSGMLNISNRSLLFMES